jgi:hypothetical protein
MQAAQSTGLRTIDLLPAPRSASSAAKPEALGVGSLTRKANVRGCAATGATGSPSVGSR